MSDQEHFDMIDLSEVGAFASVTRDGFQIRFGLYLPGIRSTDGFEVVVRIIHAADRFNPAVQPQEAHLEWNRGHTLDLWSALVPIRPGAADHFGSEGL